MDLFRTATLSDYAAWLRMWLDAGNKPTHYYDYPFTRWTWLTAQNDFFTSGECGSYAVHIIVPDGVQHIGGSLGHNQLYLVKDSTPQQQGRQVPVFSDLVFATLPEIPEFIAEQEEESARQEAEYAARMVVSANQMSQGDIGRHLATEDENGPPR